MLSLRRQTRNFLIGTAKELEEENFGEFGCYLFLGEIMAFGLFTGQVIWQRKFETALAPFAVDGATRMTRLIYRTGKILIGEYKPKASIFETPGIIGSARELTQYARRNFH